MKTTTYPSPYFLRNTHVRLCHVTCGCRSDMHEPDEQGVTAILTGFQLDNAMGTTRTKTLAK